MKTEIVLIATCAFAASLLGSCRSDKAADPGPADTSQIDSSRVTYNLKAKQIFDQNCATSTSCHIAPGQKGIVLDNYASARNATLNGKVICAVEWTCEPHMPFGSTTRLPDSTITFLKIWKARNCPE